MFVSHAPRGSSHTRPAQVAREMRELMSDMSDADDITYREIDLMPLVVQQLVLSNIMSTAEADTMLAIYETAGWAMLKLCEVNGHWMIFACVLVIAIIF